MHTKDKKRIILAGGSTAGHVLPLLDVVNELGREEFQYLYIGSRSALEDKLLKGVAIERRIIVCGKFRRNFTLISLLKNFIDLFMTLIGIFQSIVILAFYRPAIIFSKSSYVAVPVTLAAKLLSIPVVIHESDIVAGLSTRFCSRFAHAVLTAFPVNMYPIQIRKKAIYTGLPIRKEFNRSTDVEGDFILITGGSQGAQEINNRLGEIIPDLLKKNKIVHLTGELDYKKVIELKKKLPEDLSERYEVRAFDPNMPNLIKRSKLVISRSGATTIFEIASQSKKSLLFPITSGIASHQVENALFLKELKMAEVAFPEDSAKELVKKIENILVEKNDKRINQVYFPDAANYIASLLRGFVEYYELRRLRNIFLIGSGGVSMKGIAHLLKSMGIKVNGSDLKVGGHKAENINLSYDMVVYSSAADKNSEAREEHLKAEQLKIKKIKRSEMIGMLMKGFRGTSVSGMHGKTSVSMLLARLFENAGYDPTYLIGSPSSESNPSSRLGRGIDFISEACEYDGSFLDFDTNFAVITNIEEEHLDYFKGGLEEILSVFSRFILGIRPGGVLVYCIDDKNVKKLIEENKEALIRSKINLISYGFSTESNIKVSDYKVKNGFSSFNINGVIFRSEKLGEFFALNCAAMYSLGTYLGIDEQICVETVISYKGAARRFEFLGEKRGVKVFDDYAHHPTEIEVTLKALNEKFPAKRKFVIFEPHQQKRFNDFFNEYVNVFREAKIEIIGLLPVYQVAGRDENEKKSITDLVKAVNNPKVIEFEDYLQVQNFLQENLKNDDILITMGATDIYKIARDFLKS